MKSQIAIRLTSLSIDGRRVPLREGQLFAIQSGDVDGLRDVDDPSTRNWAAWVCAFNMFPVDEYAMIEARGSDGCRLEGPARIVKTATPSGTYLELSAPAGGWLRGIDDRARVADQPTTATSPRPRR